MITSLKKFVLLTILITTLSCSPDYTPTYVTYGFKNIGADTLNYVSFSNDSILDSVSIAPGSILRLYSVQIIGSTTKYLDGEVNYLGVVDSFYVYHDTVLICKNIPKTDPIFLHGHDTTYQLHTIPIEVEL